MPSPGASTEEAEDEVRDRVARLFRRIEHLFYVAVAASLALAGAILFGQVLYEFGEEVLSEDAAITDALLHVLDGLLFVFIITELLHTVRAVIAENVLSTEPFLIVGIVAAIRRIVVATAEAGESGAERFNDLMLEIGVLFGGVVALGLTIFLMRHTSSPEPVPAHEADDATGSP